uniref:Homeobox domain-containing protein n=2 Tax=Clytia hemisphaerica TaxID=252671 RepID=A0A7M5XNZ8_9CNID
AWLTTHPSVTKKFFAEEVLQRGAGTFSDYMKTTIVPTSEAGKKHWTTMAAFLDDKSTQDALLNKKASCDREKSGHSGLKTQSSPRVSSFSSQQKAILNGYYKEHCFIDKDETKELAQRTKLTSKQINTWFNNRRSKDPEAKKRKLAN